MSIPSALFNAASLDVVVAARPDLVASPPPSTSLANVADPDLASRTDAWVDALLKAPRRAALYHDERLQFHLVVSVPPPSSSSSTSAQPAPPALTRHQAAVLLLDSLPTTAHLQIAADLAYVDTTTPPGPPPLPQRSSSLHGAGAGLARAPLTPAPYPAHAAASTPTRESHAVAANEVHVARAHPHTGDKARVWVARGRQEGEWVGVWLLECDLPFVRTQLRDPRLAITVAVTLRDDPKLALLLERAKDGGAAAGEDALELGGHEADDDDEEYMEDSYDDVNLLSALAPISSHPLHLPFSRLSSFSPQPPPSLPVPRSRTISISHTRTLSASSSTSSSSGDPAHRAPAHTHHPSLRRSVRRVLPLLPAVHIDLRAVPCPVGALGLADGQGVFAQHGAGVRGGGGGGGGGGDEDELGLVLCVEVRGAAARASGGEDAQDEAFVVDSVEVIVEGAAPPRSLAPSHAGPSSTTVHDLEVRPVVRPAPTSTSTSTSSPPDRLSLHLRLAAGSPAQHNFVYALARVPGAPSGTLAAAGGGGGTEAGAATSVPRAVALSPALALQGGGRFGGPGLGAVPDEEDEEEEESAAGARGERRVSGGGAAGRSARERKVTVVVTGRPVVRRRRRFAQAGGYDVPDGAGENGDIGLEQEEDVDCDEAATAPFACRWHTTLDISSLARPASQPHRTAFATQLASASHPAAARPTSIGAALPFLPPSHAAGRLPFRPSPSTNVQVESVAGSKRHTMSSLAALSQRSPVLNRKNAGFAPVPSARPSSAASSTARALPPTPGAPPAPAPTASLVGPAAKRFFSLPPDSAEPGSSASAASSTPHIATPVRTETPSPMHGGGGATAAASGIGSAVAAAAKRVSLPGSMSGAASAARLDARPKEARRTSWMSGLVPGGGSGAVSPQPPTGPERTSWPAAPSSSTLGLGLDDPALVPQDDAVAEQPRRLPAPPPPPQQHSVGNLLISVSLVPLRAAKSRRTPFAGAGGDVVSTGPSSTSTAAAAAATGRTNAHLPPAVLPGLAISRAPSPAPVAAPASDAAEPHATPRFAFPASQPPSGSPSPSASPLPSPPLFQVYDGEAALRAQAERTSRATSRMPRVNLLDVFLVEVFLFNHSDQVKRFTVGVGSAVSTVAASAAGPRAGARRARDEDDEKVARLVPLENDVRIGPLAPNSCASVGIRFLAIRPGAHVVEALRIVDLADGSETMLERPLWVVVE